MDESESGREETKSGKEENADEAPKPNGNAEDEKSAAEENTEGKKVKRKKAKKKADSVQENVQKAADENPESGAETAAATTEESQGTTEGTQDTGKKVKAKKTKKPGKTATIRLGKKEFKVPVKRIVLCSVALVLVALLVTGGVFAYRVFLDPQAAFEKKTPFNVATPDDSEDPNQEGEIEEPSPTPDPLQVLESHADKSVYQKDIINVALIGVDHAPERDEKGHYYKDKKSYFSDVMIVLAINFKENKVDMITCPRDTYTPIYNQKGIWKLNSSFYWGYSKNNGDWNKGFENVCLTLQKLVGGPNVPPIDRYIGVDMTAVKTLVDAVGGVDYDVDLEINMQGRVLHAGQGVQHLNGQQALDYMRARKGTEEATDKERVIRQKRMLIEIFRQIKANGKLMELPGIIDKLKGQVFTNMDFEEMCAMAYFGMNLDDKNIGMRTIEGRVGAKVADVLLYNWIYSIVDAGKRNRLIEEVYGVPRKDIEQHPYFYSLDYVKLDWAKDLGASYLKTVKKILATDAALPPEEQKITGDTLLHITQRVTELEEALKAKDFSKIEPALVNLRGDMDALYKTLGRKAINWTVDENPKYPNIGG